MPVIKHYAGNCHVYVDAQSRKSVDVPDVVRAAVQRFLV